MNKGHPESKPAYAKARELADFMAYHRPEYFPFWETEFVPWPAKGIPIHAHKEASLPCASLMQFTSLTQTFISRLTESGMHGEKKQSTDWVVLG